ncbi:MAG: hypothetical protein HYV07_10195 [Deltaproteobacteria bacterium]|nr:hypothetical protein [Deltaproteobacteria bacterium]
MGEARARLLTWVLTVLTASCAHDLKPADPSRPIRFPADHAAHEDAQTEWWHFHGHVTDEEGRRYDFFLGFVKQHTDLDRVAGVPVRFFVDPFHVAYFTLSDRKSGTFFVREKHNFPDTWAASATDRSMSIRHDSWRASRRDDGAFEVEAEGLGNGLRLVLEPLLEPSLLGDQGYLYFPPRSSTHYYSIPRMGVTGSLTVEGAERRVRGLGWLKHQWGFMYDESLAGWVWFGAQLEDPALVGTATRGVELEIGVVFDRDRNLAKGSFATIRELDGALTQLDVRSIGVGESGAVWRSPRTNTVYPVGWTLTLPGRGTLSLSAAVPGQEMIVFPANLWAGAMNVTGVFDGERVGGDCFTEVVGFDEPFGRGFLASGKPEELPDDPPGRFSVSSSHPPTARTGEGLTSSLRDRGSTSSTAAPRPTPADEASPFATSLAPRAADAEAFFSSRCAVCHGPLGRGDGPAARALVPRPRDLSQRSWQSSLTDDELRRVVVEGGLSIGLSPAMPSHPELRGRTDLLEALVRLVRKLEVER